MSDPADGEEPRDAHGSGEASDEEVRAAMSDIDADGEPRDPRDPREGVPEGYDDLPAGERPPAGTAADREPSADGGDDPPEEATDDSTAADPNADDRSDAGDSAEGPNADGSTEAPADATDPALREADLSAPASATDGEHTLLEEYERRNESVWKSRARTAAFWVGATIGSVALTTTAFVSLVESGLSQGVAFFAASVALAIVVGFVFLSLQRG